MMNMFQADLAFTVELLAIGLGVAFIIWSLRSEGAGVVTAKITGYFILILAVATLLCTSYYTLRYWEEGYFKGPHAMHRQMMKKHRMMKQRIQQHKPGTSGAQ